MDREACWEHIGRSSEEDRKTHHKNAGSCQIDGSKPLVSGTSTYAALDFGWLSMVEPPRLGGELPVARNLGTFDG
ncbi:hypothetical protein GW17_00046375 [Ensete ventricosum]|nr:hypothetical protein GW17_00046375 [Ensete ventricosum]